MTLDPALLPWADKIIILVLAVLMFAAARGPRAAIFPAPGPRPAPTPDPGDLGPPDRPPVDPAKPPPVTPPVPPVARTPRNTHIVATSFAGTNDSTNSKTSAYTGKIIDSSKPGFAFPKHLSAADRARTARAFWNGKTVDGPPEDVGPWYDGRPGWPIDPYWETGTRPRAETDNRTNRAGIDLTPGAWRALGHPDPENAKDFIDWDWVDYLNTAPVPVPPVGPAQPPVTPGKYPVPTGENHLKVLTNTQCNDLFGQFTYSNGSNGDIHIDQDWVAKNIVTIEIPQLAKFKVRNVQCHRLVAPWLVKAFAEIEAAGLLGTILSYDGLWVPRHINHNASLGLSRHSDGAALDINANWNAYGTLGAKRGATGSTWEIEPIFAANGFACGRWFGWPNLPAHDTDAMHLEFCGKAMTPDGSIKTL